MISYIIWHIMRCHTISCVPSIRSAISGARIIRRLRRVIQRAPGKWSRMWGDGETSARRREPTAHCHKSHEFELDTRRQDFPFNTGVGDLRKSCQVSRLLRYRRCTYPRRRSSDLCWHGQTHVSIRCVLWKWYCKLYSVLYRSVQFDYLKEWSDYCASLT
jgi:hypothetical protein